MADQIPEIRRPDDLLFTRLGRLALLLAEAPAQPRPKPLDIERITAYDFFADNPLLLFGEGTSERRHLVLAGFDPDSFSYHSSSQRFANRRARMQHDLAHLLALDLISPSAASGRVSYDLTDAGEGLARQFNSTYADSYRASAAVIVRELNKLGPFQLRDRITQVLEARPFVIDLYRAPEPALVSGRDDAADQAGGDAR